LYSDPDAKADNISKISDNSKLSSILVDNLGYGYIGMNAKLIPDINVRRALASAFDTSLTLEYYTGGLASNIYRSMSKVSWAYPNDATNMYPFDETGTKSKEFFLKSDKYMDKNGKVVNKDGSQVEFVFTLPSSSDDHPAGKVFLKAKEVLEKIGVKVTIEVDENVLSKLESDVVAVWAAAWQATIDPDLYQVYYSDPAKNTSSSPKSFGLYYMFDKGTDEEKAILKKLNELIVQGRESLNVEERKPVYKDALNKIAELCVEIPTYQRKNMFAFNSELIDANSLWQKVTPYKGPLAEIWNVSFK
jgi:peptide/nickel transport system substrate-binding protein